ncbi:MAG: CTP synthase [Candidatus Micrarchaeota archaeon]
MGNTKYIVIVGSIMSGLGKGVLTSSIAKILQMRDYNVFPLKFDGYLNVDCGTMNPFRHGEVFVLDDGTEVDMDFGTYERFLNINLPGSASITGGKLFQKIIEKERNGDFLGRDVQFIPHLTNEIIERIKKYSNETKADIVIIEVGGTAGDLENSYFLEAMRQLSGEEQVVFIQLTYVPSISPKEQKTKPTQHANRLLLSMGIKPEIIITREQEELSEDAKEKIAMYCNVDKDAVFDDPLLETIYELPLVLEKQGLYSIIAKKLGLNEKKNANWDEWKKRVNRIINPKHIINIALIGKYTKVKDAYVSVLEAFSHAGAEVNAKVHCDLVDAEKIESGDASEILKRYNAIIVPGGFGKRGIEGKIAAIKYAREHGIPYLGLCLGMQLMIIEYARNVAKIEDVNSTEFDDKCANPVIDILPEQKQITKKGATMRLGDYKMNLKIGTTAYNNYGEQSIFERHRHRYEVNPDFVAKLVGAGLVISGTHPKNEITEMVEWKETFGIATQAHPELKSRLEKPAPLFVALLKAALKLASQIDDY